MALTDAEVQEVKFRLGYGTLNVASLPYIDGTLVFEQVVQQNLNAYGEDRVRNTILPKLRQIETDMYDSRTQFMVKALVGEVIFRDKQLQALVELQEYWISDLESTVRVPRARPPGPGPDTMTVC